MIGTKTELAAELKQAQDRQQILAEFGALALRLMPFQELMQCAVESVRKGAGAERIKILEHQPNGALLIVAGVGWKPNVVGQATLPDHLRSPPGYAFQTGKPLIIEDIRTQREFEYSDLLKEHDFISLMNVPIKSEEFTFGVLEVDAKHVTHWSEADIDFLFGFANLLTAAIQRNRMEAQRDMLLREVRHRVKNNLQLIASMMNISARESRSEEARQFLMQSALRVAAISRLYDSLDADASIDRVQLRSYFERLRDQLRAALILDDQIRIEVNVPESAIGINDAISLGLITNELVTNSVKHAFSKGHGTVCVSLSLDPDHRGGTLVVADDGVGTPAETVHQVSAPRWFNQWSSSFAATCRGWMWNKGQR